MRRCRNHRSYSCKGLLLFVGVVLILTACDKRPKGVLSDNEMLPLIVDLEMAESYVSIYHEDDNDYDMGSGALRCVLNKHNIPKANFDSTMTWYGKNVDVYQQLLVKADKELTKRQKKISGQVSADIAVADLWPYSRHYVISPLSTTDNLAFTIPVEDIGPGERLEWKARLSSIPEGEVMLGVDYETGPSSYTYRQLMGIDKLKVNLQTDTARKVKRIFGNIHIKRISGSKNILLLDSLSLGKLPFDSIEYHMIYSHSKFDAPRRKKTPAEIAKESEKEKEKDEDYEPRTED